MAMAETPETPVPLSYGELELIIIILQMYGRLDEQGPLVEKLRGYLKAAWDAH